MTFYIASAPMISFLTKRLSLIDFKLFHPTLYIYYDPTELKKMFYSLFNVVCENLANYEHVGACSAYGGWSSFRAVCMARFGALQFFTPAAPH